MEESGEHIGPEDPASEQKKEGGGSAQMVWILVDRSARERAFEAVAGQLIADGFNAQIVTITEVLGSVARDALTGGAERLLRGLRVAFQGRGPEEDLLGAVKRARPDVLAVTNPRYARALSLLESMAGIRTLQVGILPDFNLSADWINSSLQAFIVPTDEHRERMVTNGLLPERVMVAAPPIESRFVEEIDRDAVREEFGFDQTPVVLVRAEHFSPSIVEKLVFQATMVEGAARFIFHHNGDGGAAAALRRAADQYGLPAAMFGKVSDLERFVAASDLVMTAPDEPMVAEFLAQGRPLLLVGAQDSGAAQADYLSEAGAADYVADVLRLGRQIQRSIEADALKAATEAARKLGAKDGSRQVADALSVALEHAEDWLRAPASASPAGKQDTGERRRARKESAGEQSAGPFESIGEGRSRQAQDDASADKSRQTRDTDERSTQREPRYSGLSAAEAKQQLAELILLERDVERRLDEVQKQQERWRNRLQLAREWNETDLADQARETLTEFNTEADALGEELDDVRRQKVMLKRAAGAGSGRADQPRGLLSDDRDDKASARDDIERRFRRMELDSDLDDLKDKIDRDLGD